MEHFRDFYDGRGRPGDSECSGWIFLRLFIGREETGWRRAVIYTLIENVRREGYDAHAYLQWVFEKIPGMTNRDNLRELLPKAWIDLQQAGSAAAKAA